MKNETEFYKKEAEHKEELITSFVSELQSCQVERENVISECKFAENVLQPVETFLMSLIRTVDNAREIDVCAGMSTNYGYLTTRPVMLNREQSRYCWHRE